MQQRYKKSIVPIIICIALSIFLFATLSCYNSGSSTPEDTSAPVARAWTNAEVDKLVSMEYMSIYSPAPRENGVPPAECDYIHFNRFRLKDSKADTSDKDAMLLMVPGLLEGANGFEYIGRQMVYIAQKEYGLNLEIWGMDRRNNALEDLTGFHAAAAADNATDAFKIMKDYYYGGSAINGRTFKGFLTAKDVPYLSEFGLKMDTEDMFKIITSMVPDPAVRKKRVFVGGHSFGGFHTSIFAGWDLDGDPETLDDAGYNNCAGLFALDSRVSPTGNMLDIANASSDTPLPSWMLDIEKNMTEIVYIGVLTALRNGTISPFIDASIASAVLGVPLGPEIEALTQAVGMLAHMAPDEESTALQQIPISADLETMLRQYQSLNMLQYNTGIPSITKFRYTNEAFLGILFDDNFTHIPMIRVSMGFLTGGAVEEKDSDVMNKLFPSTMLGATTEHAGLFAAADAGPDIWHLGEGPLYTWANFDQIGTADEPLFTDSTGKTGYTSMVKEVSDIQDLARAMYKGQTNLIEWYFSIRRMIDQYVITMPYAVNYGLNYLHGDHNEDLPRIVFSSGNNELKVTGMATTSVDPAIVVPGYAHMDPMFASANTPSRRRHDVIYPLINFIKETINK